MNSLLNKILTASLLLINFSCSKTDRSFVTDIEGNIYKTVLAGDTWWMAENLRSATLNDGSEIPCVKDQLQWLRTGSPAYCYYLNDTKLADTLGFLYNWYAVNTGRLCPAGWHVPSDDEWKQIEGYADTRYGPGDSVWNKMGLRGYDAGRRLRSIKGWRTGVSGTDNLGFSALPGGERLRRFYAGGSSGFWWTGTEAGKSSAYYRNLIYSFEQVARDTHPKRMGFSVRCVKDK